MFHWRLITPAVRSHVAGIYKSRSIGCCGEQILYAAAQYLWLLSVQVASCYLLAAGILKVVLEFLENSCIPHTWSGRYTSITYVKSHTTTSIIVRS